MLEIAKTRKASALSRSHVSALPRDDGDLRRRHRYERRRTRWPLDAHARRAELNDVFPDVPRFAFAVPFKLLQTRRKRKDLRQPLVYPPTILSVEFAVLSYELDLPLW